MMIPFAFTTENAVELIPDARRRVLESEARKWADGGLSCRTRFKVAATIAQHMVIEHERLVWRSAYDKRCARLSRMKQHG